MDLQDILVAEDEALIRVLIEDALAEAGYAVTSLADGAAALDHLSAPDQRFVGVVTDIRMPGSVSGWDVAHRAREVRADVAIVYISADSYTNWAVHGVPESTFVQKPFAAGQIVAALSTLLNKSS